MLCFSICQKCKRELNWTATMLSAKVVTILIWSLTVGRIINCMYEWMKCWTSNSNIWCLSYITRHVICYRHSTGERIMCHLFVVERVFWAINYCVAMRSFWLRSIHGFIGYWNLFRTAFGVYALYVLLFVCLFLRKKRDIWTYQFCFDVVDQHCVCVCQMKPFHTFVSCLPGLSVSLFEWTVFNGHACSDLNLVTTESLDTRSSQSWFL